MEKEKSDYWKYYKQVTDSSKECGWRWEKCDWEEYKKIRKENKWGVCKSRH